MRSGWESNHRSFADEHRIAVEAAQGAVVLDYDVFVRDDAVQGRIRAHERPLHQNTILYHRAAVHLHVTEHDGMANRPLDVAPIRDQRMGYLRVQAVDGGRFT